MPTIQNLSLPPIQGLLSICIFIQASKGKDDKKEGDKKDDDKPGKPSKPGDKGDNDAVEDCMMIAGRWAEHTLTNGSGPPPHQVPSKVSFFFCSFVYMPS